MTQVLQCMLPMLETWKTLPVAARPSPAIADIWKTEQQVEDRLSASSLPCLSSKINLERRGQGGRKRKGKRKRRSRAVQCIEEKRKEKKVIPGCVQRGCVHQCSRVPFGYSPRLQPKSKFQCGTVYFAKYAIQSPRLNSRQN